MGSRESQAVGFWQGLQRSKWQTDPRRLFRPTISIGATRMPINHAQNGIECLLCYKSGREIVGRKLSRISVEILGRAE